MPCHVISEQDNAATAVASVGSGLKSIFKKIGKLRDRVRQEGEDEKQSESSDQIRKALRKKPAPKLEKK
jgi:hypothetical protein